MNQAGIVIVNRNIKINAQHNVYAKEPYRQEYRHKIYLISTGITIHKERESY